MRDYIIFTDSAADLSREQLEKWDIKMVPLKFKIDEKTYCNDHSDQDMAPKKFYDLLRARKTVSTSQANVEDFKERFRECLVKGLDILYIAFSSVLSGTYNSATIAIKELKEEYPNSKIIAVDTLSASFGEGLLVYYALQKKKENFTIEQTAKFIEEIKLNVCHWFTLDDLFHLKRGGRISATAAVLGSMLGIRPILHVDNKGNLVMMRKIRGRQAALNALLDEMRKSFDPKASQIVGIAIIHSDADEDAKFLKEQIIQTFNVKNIFIQMIGPVIGGHVGPGTIGLIFLGNER
jgi:DegV family protein with EDD domain